MMWEGVDLTLHSLFFLDCRNRNSEIINWRLEDNDLEASCECGSVLENILSFC